MDRWLIGTSSSDIFSVGALIPGVNYLLKYVVEEVDFQMQLNIIPYNLFTS